MEQAFTCLQELTFHCRILGKICMGGGEGSWGGGDQETQQQLLKFQYLIDPQAHTGAQWLSVSPVTPLFHSAGGLSPADGVQQCLPRAQKGDGQACTDPREGDQGWEVEKAQ